MRMQEQFRSPS